MSYLYISSLSLAEKAKLSKNKARPLSANTKVYGKQYKYKAKHQEKVSAQQKKYYREHRQELLSKSRERYKQKRKEIIKQEQNKNKRIKDDCILHGLTYVMYRHRLSDVKYKRYFAECKRIFDAYGVSARGIHSLSRYLDMMEMPAPKSITFEIIKVIFCHPALKEVEPMVVSCLAARLIYFGIVSTRIFRAALPWIKKCLEAPTIQGAVVSQTIRQKTAEVCELIGLGSSFAGTSAYKVLEVDDVADVDEIGEGDD